jgi:hypothetical protein
MLRFITAIAALATAATLTLAEDEHHHTASDHHVAATSSGSITVTGEVLDMACYLDHGAQGDKHADCAKTCIEGGLPVGIKSADGKTYLLIGEHKPLNKQLAPYAAKTITVKGKLVERDGFKAIANAEIVKASGK